ncbi:MAG: carboxy terminal-processing peptidase, partial [Elusimicrobiota bacterium]
QWIQEDMTRWEKQKKDKSLSLNEKTRLAERKTEEDRQSSRKKERGARKEKPYPSEEITLAILDGKAPAVSTTTALTRPPDPFDEEEPGYERGVDAPDAVLDETLRIAVDLTAALPPATDAQAARRARNAVTQ